MNAMMLISHYVLNTKYMYLSLIILVEWVHTFMCMSFYFPPIRVIYVGITLMKYETI